MKYAFHEIILQDLDGNPIKDIALHKFLANAIYVHAKNLDLVEKALVINKGQEVDLSTAEVEQLVHLIDDEKIGIAAFARKALKEYLTSK